MTEFSKKHSLHHQYGVADKYKFQIVNSSNLMRRFFAALLDLFYMSFFIGQALRLGRAYTTPELDHYFIILGFLFTNAINAYGFSKFGHSLGKAAFQLKLLDINQKKFISFTNAFWRETIVKPISFLMAGIPLLTIFFNKDRRTLYDQFLKSRVVRVKFVAEKIDKNEVGLATKTLLTKSKYLQNVFAQTRLIYFLGSFQMILITAWYYYINMPSSVADGEVYGLVVRVLLVGVLALAFLLKKYSNNRNSISNIQKDYQGQMSSIQGVDCLESQRLIANRFFNTRGTYFVFLYSIFGMVFSILPLIDLYRLNLSIQEYFLWCTLTVLTAIILIPKKSEFNNQLSIGA